MGQVATPALIVTESIWSFQEMLVVSMILRRRSASRIASLTPVPGATTMNSSPP